jgi:hypothetical protein
MTTPRPQQSRDSDRPVEPGEPADPGAGDRDGPGRPLIERIGMAAIAGLMAAMFGVVAIVSFVGGEVFLAAMAAIGSLMTLWVGAITLLRG